MAMVESGVSLPCRLKDTETLGDGFTLMTAYKSVCIFSVLSQTVLEIKPVYIFNALTKAIINISQIF